MRAWARRAATAAGLALVAWATPRAAGAQFYFGQNQVQYDRLDWRVLETEHFLVHYYPVEREAAMDAARMAERSYARLSRLLQHQFREKKPIIVYASRGDFAQSNTFGDLGEGTGGVTDILRQRMAQPLTGDYRSFEHVLMHEMVHQFQYDIFSRGKAGAGIQNYAQVNPPLWFMEGMAEFLSIGYDHAQTDTWMRDAAINGKLPTIKDMTERPYEFFPYRFGFALWQYVGQRWGDEVVGEIMNAVPNVGIERAFKRELGLSLEELGDEWKEATQLKHLPRLATLDRARKFSQALLTQRKTGGFVDAYTAPALSPDGKYIAFISYGSLLRGEITPSLFLADAETGKRLKRLVESGFNTNAEELRQLYSQSSFSPDGRYLAFTGMRQGKDVLYLLDVRRRRTVRRFDLPLEGVTSPSWSPDGRQLVFSGTVGGISDLFLVNSDGSGFRRLTNDRFGDNQPAWSPDGKTIAFASDRDTDFETLRLAQWKVSLYDLATGRVTTVDQQDGLNINPQWAPDGQSIAYVSDRTGIPNLFLYDLGAREHYQLTNVVGAVNGQTEYSPAITWARGTDVLAYTYFEKGTNNVWAIKNPRLLKKQPFRAAPAAPVIAAGDTTTRPRAGLPGASAMVTDAIANTVASTVDTTPDNRSLYRPPSSPSFRQSSSLPALGGRDVPALSVTALLDSAELALPDTARFRDTRYRAGFQPEYIAQPQVGYAQNNFGQGVFGGTAIVLGDLLSNHQLTLAGAVNGQVSDAVLFGSYTNLSRRLQYTTGISQQPVYVPTNSSGEQFAQGTIVTDTYQRWIERQAFGAALYPLSRFRRLELGARLSRIGLSEVQIRTAYDNGGFPVGQEIGGRRSLGSANLAAPYFAYVSDNALFGYTSPIMGRRVRLQLEPTVGSWRYIDWLVDYRRYDPILFNFLTLATRVNANITAGRDERLRYKWIGRPDLVRGYNRDQYQRFCGGIGFDGGAPGQDVTLEDCSILQLVGSRVALANVELRFPLIRRFDLGVLPIGLPPVDALVFYDAGIAWYGGQHSLTWKRPENYDLNTQRFALRSYGFGVRFNLFGFAILRWDYAKPLDQPGRKPFGTWFIGPSF
jgi:Tol biopolymer transport system component